MRFDSVFILFFLSLATIAVAHYLAMAWYLYWIYPSFDIPMHFLGGATVALGLGTSLVQRFSGGRANSLVAVLLIVLAVGVAWEIFEWIFGIANAVAYVADTSLDLAMDLSGGAVGYWITTALRRAEL